MLYNILYNYHDSSGGNNDRVRMGTTVNTMMMMIFEDGASRASGAPTRSRVVCTQNGSLKDTLATYAHN